MRHHPRRNATPPAPQCDTTRVAMRHRPRRNATPPRRNATPPAPQCDATRAAMRHHPRRNATPPAPQGDPPRRKAPPSVRTCALMACDVTNRCLLALPLDIPTQPTYTIGTKSKIVRSPALAAVGGTGVLEKHIRPVPARELSYLLLPRALEVCTHLRKTSTGSIGASPRLPAGGRSHLSTSRDVTSGLTARVWRLCHE